MVEAKLLRKKLKNGLIVDKWDLVTIIEKQEAEIEALKLQVKGYQQSTKHYRELHEGFSTINELGFQQIELNAEILRKAQEK